MTRNLMTLRNEHVEGIWHMYMMQPGDATVYRFGFMYYPEDTADAYVIDDGVSGGGEYIKFYIHGGYSAGISVVSRAEILHFPEWGTHVLGYLKGHGMKDVVEYTLTAVMLALKVLVIDPTDVERAAKFMLDVPKVLYKDKEDEDATDEDNSEVED